MLNVVSNCSTDSTRSGGARLPVLRHLDLAVGASRVQALGRSDRGVPIRLGRLPLHTSDMQRHLVPDAACLQLEDEVAILKNALANRLPVYRIKQTKQQTTKK